MRRYRRFAYLFVVAAVAGCATAPVPRSASDPPAAEATAPAEGRRSPPVRVKDAVGVGAAVVGAILSLFSVVIVIR